jgi:hypothetical protein
MAEILISREMLEYLRKDNGSDFSAIETPKGYLIKVNDPEVERQLSAALKIMDQYEETLRILAK